MTNKFNKGDIVIYSYGQGSFEKVEILKVEGVGIYAIRYLERYGSTERSVRESLLLTKAEAQEQFNKFLG